MVYKDIFIHRIYHLDAQRVDPLILDCCSNIGRSILYSKHVYPRARIIGSERDPTIFPYLQENVRVNGLKNVELVQAVLAGQKGTMTFFFDGKYGSVWRKTRNLRYLGTGGSMTSNVLGSVPT